MTSKSQLRRHARLPFEDQMQVFWKDARGQVQNQRAKCLELSAEGARLETAARIPPRTTITLQSARYGSLGTASVRHSERHTLNYWIGVEFTAAQVLAERGRKRCLEAMQPTAESRS